VKTRREPARMCVACRQMKPKRELIRVVRTAGGRLETDETGKKPGRGAYVCVESRCLAEAQKRRKLERAFEGADTQGVYEAIAAIAQKRAATAAATAAMATTAAATAAEGPNGQHGPA